MTTDLLLVWRDTGSTRHAFADALVDFASRHADSDPAITQVAVADAAVEPASGLRQMTLDPQPEALLRVVTDHPHDAAADIPNEVVEALRALRVVDHLHVYRVTTRAPLVDPAPAQIRGSRSRGWTQVALLRRRADLTTEAFRQRWLTGHTRVAIELQSTFRYVQHVVEHSSGDAPALDGIVEESFPLDAMDDPHAFFATGGDQAVLDQRLGAMVHSVSGFLDLDRLDVIPMSEHRFDR